MKDNGIFERVDENKKVIKILEELKKDFEEGLDDYDAFIGVAIRDGDKEKEKGLKEEKAIWEKRIWALDVATNKINKELKEDIKALDTLFNFWVDDDDEGGTA